MSDLYLIAHRVRGEPAFDCAERMECPECHGNCVCERCGSTGLIGPHNYDGVCPDCSGQSSHGCTECDSFGYWWIIPTSGHRAYPYWAEQMNYDEHQVWFNQGLVASVIFQLPAMPNGQPDHYHHTASPATVRARLEDLLSALPPTPTTPFKRRF